MVVEALVRNRAVKLLFEVGARRRALSCAWTLRTPRPGATVHYKVAKAYPVERTFVPLYRAVLRR